MIRTTPLDDGYLDDEDSTPVALHRVGGPAIGLSAERWPRHRGRCMQHAFTIDLEGIELPGVAKARGMRAVSVFLESYYEQDPESSDGIAVV